MSVELDEENSRSLSVSCNSRYNSASFDSRLILASVVWKKGLNSPILRKGCENSEDRFEGTFSLGKIGERSHSL